MNTHHQLTKDQLTAYATYLRAEERSPGTIENYLRQVRAFAVWADGRPNASMPPPSLAARSGWPC